MAFNSSPEIQSPFGVAGLLDLAISNQYTTDEMFHIDGGMFSDAPTPEHQSRNNSESSNAIGRNRDISSQAQQEGNDYTQITLAQNRKITHYEEDLTDTNSSRILVNDSVHHLKQDFEQQLVRSQNDSQNSARLAEHYLSLIGEEGYCVKLKSFGNVNVYRLNATESPTEETNLRSFDIYSSVQPTGSGVEHKIIILMGATGSGKSTLINGMINYILGVNWDDSFRFDVIREDEEAGRNQAHSQTSSVTAYTLHHQHGMRIPYSITIIDTPGYGDTRGIERDKEITKAIHRFLTGNVGRIDLVHAVCFVAASGNSRLTHTQRYILDSVMSIFGKDVKDNIRLLVTFADNIDPPVVDACREAGFPLPSDSDGVAFSKFNSSVLFVSNTIRKGEDESGFHFDKLFWDMGQENFKKFFDVLEGLKGCGLESTREVIAHRQKAQQIVKDLEQELTTYLGHIEDIEIMLSVIVNGYRTTEVTAPIVAKLKAHYEAIEKRKMTNEELVKACLEDSEKAKNYVVNILMNMERNAKVLDSKTLRSNALGAADYLSLLKSRVAEEQRPGYLTRLETLASLQSILREQLSVSTADASPAGHIETPSPVETTEELLTGQNELSTTHDQLSISITADGNSNSGYTDTISTVDEDYRSVIMAGEDTKSVESREMIISLMGMKKRKTASPSFVWFDIYSDRFDNREFVPALKTTCAVAQRDHKFIVLMGVTSGVKSLFIDGIVNYVLGVQWEEPVRFRVVRQDETDSHSQNTTITAYTLRYEDGMAVPYSITIIDAPYSKGTNQKSNDSSIGNVMYSEFRNGGALFAPNSINRKENDESEVMKDLWNMSKTIFKNFFDALSGFNGCFLETPKDAIQRRHLSRRSSRDNVPTQQLTGILLAHIESMNMLSQIVLESSYVTKATTTSSASGDMKIKCDKFDKRNVTNGELIQDQSKKKVLFLLKLLERNGQSSSYSERDLRRNKTTEVEVQQHLEILMERQCCLAHASSLPIVEEPSGTRTISPGQPEGEVMPEIYNENERLIDDVESNVEQEKPSSCCSLICCNT